MFDALKHADDLKAVNFTDPQARAVLRLVQESTEHTATSKADLQKTQSKLEKNLLETENRLKEDIAAVKTDIAVVQSEVRNLDRRFTTVYWIFGVQTALIFVILGKLFNLI